ncbi:MAG: type II toxin-antitoxin system HicB family antitoxin [Chloroflexi bacterium]|nr:type II toxin-antitoxin system HicB family antitoxin [Chloroflexota bacterium]
MSREFTGVIEKRGDWYIGYVEELPGVNTQGRTLKEVRENLKEATQLIIEANRDLAENVGTGL